MPLRPAIDLLAPEIRAELDSLLVANGFGNYNKMEQWLADRGCQIGKSQIHRYGSKLERKLANIKASTEAARAIADAAPDDADHRSSAVISMIQTEVFTLLSDMQDLGEEEDPAARVKVLARVAEAMATLSRASVNLKTYQTKVADRVNAAAAAVDQVVKEAGLTDESAEKIRAKILGIKQ